MLGAVLNLADVLLCRGQYQVRPALPFTPGIELCGEVLEAGNAIAGWSPGERAIGSGVLPYGAFAEQAAMEPRMMLRVPRSLDPAEASALYAGYQTAWMALHRRAVLRPGETLVVSSAPGGVGAAAVQVGRAAGARVIGIARGAEKATFARSLGVDFIIDRDDDVRSAVRDATSGRGAEVVLDTVGGRVFDVLSRCVAAEGGSS